MMARNAVLCLFLLVVVLAMGQGQDFEPPVCTSQFDHQFKVLQKLADLDFEIRQLKSTCKCEKGSSTSCPDGWVGFEGRCYYFLSEQRTFSGGDVRTHTGGYPRSTHYWNHGHPTIKPSCNTAYCKEHGAKLAEPRTTSANEFIKGVARQYKTKSWWIGLNDEKVEGTWEWLSDGSTPTFHDWKNGNPNGGTRCNCGGLWYQYDYGWVDEPCDYRYNVICEKI